MTQSEESGSVTERTWHWRVTTHVPLLVAGLFTIWAIWADGRWQMVAVAMLFLLTAADRGADKAMILDHLNELERIENEYR